MKTIDRKKLMQQTEINIDGNPKVSIIILNWNTTEITCALLRSLKDNLTYSNIEIIIVDNGSIKNPSTDFLAILDSIKIIINPTNYGFSAGCNIGVKEATGNYYFFLNSDTEITTGVIESLLSTFFIDKQTGLVSPVINCYNDQQQVEYAGYTKIHPITGRSKVLTTGIQDLLTHNGLSETVFAYGAAMMISKEVYDDVGGLYEPYFAYYEELDWSNRVREKGYKIYCNLEAKVFHKGSMSTATNTPFKTFLLTRNRMLYMKRNSYGVNYFLFMFYFLLIASPKNLMSYMISFQFDNFIAYLKALGCHLRGQSQYIYKTKEENIVLIRSMN